MANVVSYSLWGKEDFYYDGDFANIDLVKEKYPGFIPRFYCSPSMPDKWHHKYTDNGAEVVTVAGHDNWKGLFWRFYAFEEDGIVLIRDTDSRIIDREVRAVNAWLESKYDFHAMRDHKEHTTTPVLGGMFGARNGILKDIKSQIMAWKPKDKKGDDQEFLFNRIWPKVRDNALVHCRYARPTQFSEEYTYDPWKFFGKHKIMLFPGELPGDEFVGEIVK